jgi:hypothetical protein
LSKLLSNGNGWMHNLQLMRNVGIKCGSITPFTRLNHSPQQHNDDDSNNDNNSTTSGRLRNYHRIRYLTNQLFITYQ